MEKSNQNNKILLIDGHSISNRAFYGIPPLSNKDGLQTNAILGFMNIMLKVIEEEQPTQVGVAFDVKQPTFRHKMFEDYKGTRTGMPDDLRVQMPYIKEMLKTLDIEIFEKPGFEADDVLGTLAKKNEEKGNDVVILSGDRDLLQLASEKVKLKIPKTSKGKTTVEVYYAKDVEEVYGVTPKEFIEVKALMGDKSDNIPGVPSIGEKTATKIIQNYKTVENAIAHAKEVKPKRASENLITYAEQARLSKTLAEICIDCDIESTLTDFTMEQFHNETFINFIREMDFKALLNRFDVNGTSEETVEAEDIDNEIINNKDALQKALDKISDTKEMAVHILNQEDYQLIGLCIEANKTFTIQVNEDMNLEHVLEMLSPLIQNAKIKKYGHHVKEWYKLGLRYGFELKGLALDTFLAAYLLKPTTDTYKISELTQQYLNLRTTELEDILGTGKNKKSIHEIDSDTMYNFCARQVNSILELQKVLLAELEQKSLKSLYEDIEQPLISVLAEMEHTGVKVNKHGLQSYGEKLQVTIDALNKSIYELAGEEFNINSPKQLGVILFEKLGLRIIKKTKTGYSTAAEVLDALKDDHPIINQVLEYRQLVKLKSTYADGLMNVIDQETEKIYSTFNQAVTATGRISSTDPNLQNIPIRMALGRELRKVFVPRSEDYIFVDADYSQIELRLVAHLSGDEAMINAYKNNEDIHRLTASQVFNTPFEEVTDLQRSNAKAVNFGIIYGISAFSLSKDLGITQKEAKHYIETYFAKYPKVKAYLDECVAIAKEQGYATTIFGRKRDIPELKSRNFVQRGFGERVAMNMPIQGAAADIIKIAMIQVNDALKDKNLKSKLILQVHDELLIEAHRDEIDEVKEILLEKMMHCVALSVPLEIDMHTGENWYEAK